MKSRPLATAADSVLAPGAIQNITVIVEHDIGSRNGKAQRRRPAPPVHSNHRPMEDAFTRHRAALGDTGVVDVSESLAIADRRRFECNTVAVHKYDRCGKRFVDRINRLWIKCIVKCRKRRH